MQFQFSAGAIIYRKEKGLEFLLLRKHNGDYDLAKGHIEKGETAEQAAAREIEEETGLRPDFIPYFKRTTKYFFMENHTKVLKSLKLFIAKTDSSMVRISYEHVTYDWVSYEEAIKKLRHKNYARVFADAIIYIKKWEEMQALNKEYAQLPSTQSDWTLSTRMVPGDGRLDAELMFVGQAPGDNEDKQGKPFIGRSGRLLDTALNKARLRRQDLYITSVVQFFPPKNRLPTRQEVELCSGFLKRQIDIIKPSYMILLGNLAGQALLGMGNVEKNHGKIVKKDGRTYMLTYHPAAALRFKKNVKPLQDDIRKLAAAMKK